MLVYIRAACLSSVHGGRGELYNWLPITTGAGDWCLVPGLVVLRLLTSHSDFHRTVQCIRLEVRCRRGWESFYYPASWLAGYITTSSHCKQANLYRLDTLILLSSSSQLSGLRCVSMFCFNSPEFESHPVPGELRQVGLFSVVTGGFCLCTTETGSTSTGEICTEEEMWE